MVDGPTVPVVLSQICLRYILEKNMVSGGCLILRGDFNWLVVVFLNIVIDMIRNHLLFLGMGWEHQPAKHASAVEACR